MKKLINFLTPATLGLIALSSSQVSFADTEMRVSKIESQMRDCATSNARGTFGGKLADASPNIDGYGFYISADAVIYQLQQQNSTYANITSAAVPSPLNSSILSSQATTFDWDWGFKVGLGYYAEHDNWQTGFAFTYLETQTSGYTASDFIEIPNNVIPNYLVYQIQSQFTANTAKDNWKVHYYNLDWKIGRDFFVSKYLSFLPEVGVKTAWFYQTRNLYYTGLYGVAADSACNIYNHDDFQGVGPKMDVVAKLWLGRHFSLFGSVDAALLFASNKVSNYTYLSQGGLSPNTETFDQTRQKYNQVTPYFGFNLGLAYDTNFMDDAFNFGIKLSYEQDYYRGASRLYNNDAPSQNDISMQGVDLSFLFSF